MTSSDTPPDKTSLDHLGEKVEDFLEKREQDRRQQAWAQKNRLGLLWVHGLTGVIVGLAMLLFGTSSNLEVILGIWTRSVLAGLGISGGLFVIYGLTRKPVRSIKLEQLGLVILAIWDLAIMASLVIVNVVNHPHFAYPWEPIPETAGRPYAIGIYASLFFLLLLHIFTLTSLTNRKSRHRRNS